MARTKGLYRVTAEGSTANTTMQGMPRVSAKVVAKCENHAKTMLSHDRSLTQEQLDSLLYTKVEVVYLRHVTPDTFYGVVIEKKRSS
jgi:predicted NAD/FAD-binding protein